MVFRTGGCCRLFPRLTLCAALAVLVAEQEQRLEQAQVARAATDGHSNVNVFIFTAEPS